MTNERRRYYRINDEASLAVEQIGNAEIDARLEDFWENEHAFSIRNNFNFQIEQHIADRHKIDSKMPELGRYLAVLEKQIERLTNKLVGDDNDHAMAQKSVNLSAQGIAYCDDQVPEQDALVELKLKLLPSGFRLVIIARVVKIEKDQGDDQGNNRVSLDFEHLHEADREILIKHVHGKQMESLGSSQAS
ncbi:MAG: PilZ domain-containing protein [Gammaproteobacteria bacterium]|nr:PilZ domain-containing protein [Gammaproteobacteria bacterium]MDH3858956.1 PilZ domain-containing protein [Gammaproteobacteria bacterium]